MFPLFETIRIKFGEYLNLEEHEKRIEYSLFNYFGIRKSWCLKTILPNITLILDGKLRLDYCNDNYKYEITPIEKKEIKFLRLVYDNEVNYSIKKSDRSHLLKLYEQCMGCDDILIVKDNRITDTSICNIVFFNGREWVTPKFPLLKGTQRSLLIKTGVIKEKDLLDSDICEYKKFKLINALRVWDEQEEYPIDYISPRSIIQTVSSNN